MQLTTLLASLPDNLLNDLLNHPFNTDLSKGTLSTQVFSDFIYLDQEYLAGFVEVLNQLAARSVNQNHQVFFENLANMTKQAEISMLDTYRLSEHPHRFFQQHTSRPLNKLAMELYLKHLSICSQDPDFAVAIWSVVPCLYLYRELGKQMSQTPTANNQYQSWIDTYSDESFLNYTEQLIQIAEELSAHTELSEQVSHAFKLSFQFELDFFASVYTALPESNNACDVASITRL